MRLTLASIVSLAATFSSLSFVASHPQDPNIVFNNLTSPYTLSVYAPGNTLYNGAKANDFYVFEVNVSSYCPFTGDQASQCPNGTQQAFFATLTPDCEVPGGQDLYVNVDGSIAITVQHSHSFPPGSWPEYYGWTWTALPVDNESLPGCPAGNDSYVCDAPTGFFSFQAPDATVGGIKLCPNQYYPTQLSVWAVTPEFNQTQCVDVLGLGTHTYAGPNPPVWAYY